MSLVLTPWPSAFGPQADFFQSLCAQAAAELRAAPVKQAAAQLGDPRALHRRLYAAVLPDSRRHLAGAYRGSAHPDLANLIVAFAFNEAEGTDVLARPQKVQELMFAYGGLIRSFLATSPLSVEDSVQGAARLIAAFGYIHPFWDGNGHLQRLTFETLLARKGIAMNAKWSIHPRPYGFETQRALAERNPAQIAAHMMKFVAAGPARESVGVA
jgi:fido (protein-threonine AMPylation protein)